MTKTIVLVVIMIINNLKINTKSKKKIFTVLLYIKITNIKY